METHFKRILTISVTNIVCLYKQPTWPPWPVFTETVNPVHIFGWTHGGCILAMSMCMLWCIFAIWWYFLWIPRPLAVILPNKMQVARGIQRLLVRDKSGRSSSWWRHNCTCLQLHHLQWWLLQRLMRGKRWLQPSMMVVTVFYALGSGGGTSEHDIL